ncbi:MAG: acetolactate synthase small subunit, partial [Methanobrevibacter sp.]|nr:acetolactate synthase small subunit [Methanobrevibacter sp.]
MVPNNKTSTKTSTQIDNKKPAKTSAKIATEIANESNIHVISTLVEDRPGVLQRVASLFTRRGFNIESITVGGSETEGFSRMVILAKGDEKVLEQITKQLNKLVDIIKVKDLDPQNTLKRELCLIKVKVDDEKKRSEIIQYTNIFRGKIIDVSENSLIIEITGNPSKI